MPRTNITLTFEKRRMNKMELTVKPLKYKELPGLSEKQLSEHHDKLYAGYVNKTNEIRKKLETADRGTANGTYSDFRELKVEETFALNGVKLHENYFDNMGGNGTLDGTIADWIAADFGSFENWKADFEACGKSARGWVVLAFDLDSGKLFNVLCDLHNIGGVWNTIPLLVMDVYEHAYFIDYATARPKYIEAFFKTIDYAEVNARIEKLNLAQYRQ